MSKSALASLTAQYTDSENEEEQQDEGSSDSVHSQASLVIIPKAATPLPSPERPKVNSTSKKKTRSKKVRRLVSYQDDTVISDEDDPQEVSDSSESSVSESDEDSANEIPYSEKLGQGKDEHEIRMELDDDPKNDFAREPNNSTKAEKSLKYAHYGFSLPSEPKGKPAAELVDKITNLYEKMETNNMDMNRIIQERKEFRNPSIYEKLIQFCDINELGTNYPPELYDPLQWGVESYYEELARVQKNEMMRRQKERKESDKIEQATALARKVEEEAKKRKSKWDQPAPPVKPAAPLTTTVTGTKGTVISAFGTLPKKPPA